MSWSAVLLFPVIVTALQPKNVAVTALVDAQALRADAVITTRWQNSCESFSS